MTIDERIAVAKAFVADMDISIPVIVDGIDNKTNDDYKAWPDRLYIVDKNGKIMYKGDKGPRGYKPLEMVEALETLETIAKVHPASSIASTWGSLKTSL